MNRQQVTDKLAAHRRELKAMGVVSLSLFGSAARGEATGASDVDMLVEFDRPIGLFEFVDVKLYLEKLLDVPEVDLVMRDALIEELKDDILSEAIRVA